MKLFIIIFLTLMSSSAFSDNFEWKSMDTMRLENNYGIYYLKIDCYDKNNCMAVANAAFTMPVNRITSDGGNSWVTTLVDTQIVVFEPEFKIYHPPKAYDMIYNKKTSMVFCDEGIYWRDTEDGWVKDTMDAEPPVTAHFPNDSVGFVCWRYLNMFKTYDSGKNWKKLDISFKEHDTLPINFIIRVSSIDENNILALAAYSHVDTTNNRPNVPDMFIIKSTDGGYTWDISPDNNLIQRVDLHFINEKIGFTVGAPSINNKRYSRLSMTTDGGNTWEIKIDSLVKFSEGLIGVDFVSDSVGFAWGMFFELWRTTDGGNTWKLLRTWEQATEYLYNRTLSYSFIDERTVYTVDRSWGIIYKGTITPTGIISFEPYYIPDLIHLYPNPVSRSESLQLQIQSPITDVVSLKVYNTSGQLCGSEFKTHLTEGINTIEYNPGNLSPGNYYLKLIYSDGIVYDEKFIVK